MVYIIYGKHENNDLVSAVNDKEHVVICDSFSIFSEEIKTIKKILNETDEKDCILVHDEKCSVPVGEALYLLERCGADRVFDWCCSPNWQLYIEEASNAPLLNIVDGYYLTELNGTHLETANNPFTSVLFGKETDGIWNERPYSIHVTRECISIRRIIRNALVKNISESFGRNCTKKDYDDFKKEHGLWLDGIGECIQKDVLIKSFYDDDLQWENVFSKRSTLNTGKILRQRLNEFEGDIEQNVRTVKGYFRDILRDAVVRCTERPGYGIRFAHEFLTMFLIPEITSFMEASSEQYNQLKDAEMKFKQEVDESAYAALHVSRFTGDREFAVEEYVAALESYWGCLVRQVKLKALYDIYEDIEKSVRISADRIEQMQQKREAFAAKYVTDFDDDTLNIYQINPSDSKMVDEFLADEKYEELEQILKDKYAQDIADIIKIRKRNSSVKILDDDIVWYSTEEVKLYNRMTDQFFLNVKTDKERDDVYRKWVWQYFEEGILEKTDDGFTVRSQDVYDELDKKQLSLSELLKIHRKIEETASWKVLTVIPVTGTINVLVRYLQEHNELITMLDEQRGICYKNKLIREQCRKELSSFI